MGSPPGDDAEQRLFEKEMRDVRRLEHEAAVPAAEPTPHPAPARRVAAASPAFEIETAGEQVAVFHPSLPPRARKALRTTPPERTLDLHGTRSAQAARELERFVSEAVRSGVRCLLVITGRGLRSGAEGPVLRAQVVRLLTETPLAANVLAAASAPPPRGGTGALLVLLRKA